MVVVLQSSIACASVAVVPAGTELYLGRIAPNRFGGLKGVLQIYAPDFSNIKFEKSMVLNDTFGGL